MEHIRNLMDGRVGGGEYQFRPLHPDNADIAADRNPHFLLEFTGEVNSFHKSPATIPAAGLFIE